MNDKTVINRPPSRVTAHRGWNPKAYVVDLVDDLLGQCRTAAPRQAGPRDDGETIP